MSLHSGTLSRPRANDYLHFLLNQFYNLSFNPIRDRTHTYLSKREDFDSFNWFNFDTFLCLTQVRAISSVVFIHVYWCLSFHSCVLMFEFSFMCIDVWVFIHVYWCLSFHSCVLMFEFSFMCIDVWVFIHVYWCLSFHSCVLMFEFSFMCIDVWVWQRICSLLLVVLLSIAN
jgi:hypothetical protein